MLQGWEKVYENKTEEPIGRNIIILKKGGKIRCKAYYKPTYVIIGGFIKHQQNPLVVYAGTSASCNLG